MERDLLVANHGYCRPAPRLRVSPGRSSMCSGPRISRRSARVTRWPFIFSEPALWHRDPEQRELHDEARLPISDHAPGLLYQLARFLHARTLLRHDHDRQENPPAAPLARTHSLRGPAFA